MANLPVDGPVAFELDGREYVLDVPATDWISAVGSGDLNVIIPFGLSDDDCAELLGRLDDDDDTFDLDNLQQLIYVLLEAATGFKWWVAFRLLKVVAEKYSDVDAYCCHRGIDLRGAPLSRVCAATLALLRAGCSEEKDFRKLDSNLYSPPPGEKKYSDVEARKKEAASFQALQSAFGSRRGPATKKEPADNGPAAASKVGQNPRTVAPQTPRSSPPTPLP